LSKLAPAVTILIDMRYFPDRIPSETPTIVTVFIVGFLNQCRKLDHTRFLLYQFKFLVTFIDPFDTINSGLLILS